MSRYRVAQLIGLTTQGYVNLETGASKTASWDTIKQLADVFGVTTDSFREAKNNS